MSNVIGKKLKQIRNSKGMTLKELGDAVGLSVGYLSQLERGKSSIAINQLEKIAECFGVNVRYFVSEDAQTESPVMKSYENDVLYIESELSIQYRITSNIKDKKMLPKIDVLMPGFTTEGVHCHKGEEFIYILEGVLTFSLDDKTYSLYPGDTAHYSAVKVHSWENNTNKPVKVLVVSVPNPFMKDETQSKPDGKNE